MATTNDKLDRQPSEGALRLRAYLDAHTQTIYAFCEATGLDRVQVQRVISGERGQRITVAFASAIEHATGGEVPMSAWVSAPPTAAGSGPKVSDAAATGEHPAVKPTGTGEG
jgi:hypothetical protein